LELLGVSVSSYYYSTSGRKEAEGTSGLPKSSVQRDTLSDERILEEIIKYRGQFPTYGVPRMTALLRNKSHMQANHKRVYRIMKDNRLLLQRKRFKAARRRARKAWATAPHQHWQTDMTKFEIPGFGWVYLFLVVDVFSRKIVGWHLGTRARAKDAIKALEMAIRKELWPLASSCGRHLTLRSDNGCQYLSRTFFEYIKRINNLVTIHHELTGYNQPEGNAYVERTIRTVNEEEIWLQEYQSFSEGRTCIARFIEFYNNERMHSALGYMSPEQFIESLYTRTPLVASLG
jgi:putative transposase